MKRRRISLRAYVHQLDKAFPGVLVVNWTCQMDGCGHRNRNHRWYGTDEYFCFLCDCKTVIRGTTKGAYPERFQKGGLR